MLEHTVILGLSAPPSIPPQPDPSLPAQGDAPPAGGGAPGQGEAPAYGSFPVQDGEAGEDAARSEPPVQSEPPAQSEAPEESGPAWSQKPGESAPAQTEPVVSVPPDPVPPAPPVPAAAWIGLGAALAAAVIGAALLARRKRRGIQPAAQPFLTERPAGALPAVPQAAPAVRIGKLHQQGARSSQQDCFSVSPEDIISSHGLLAVVADGMGGLSDGDKVSQAAVSAMVNGFFLVQGEPDQVLLTLLEQANHQVNRLLGPEGCGRSGSTLVAGLARDGFFHFLSVGDSRVCLYRDGALYQLNREHIFRRELELRAVNREEALSAAAAHPKAAGLTSYLGMGQLKYVDMPAQPTAIRPGDKFILMSDGVYNALTQEELAACLEGGPEEAALALDGAIREKNYSNQDNYTAVILGF